MHFGEMFTNLPLPLLHNWGYWLLLFAAFLEAMPFGFLVPGHFIVIASGFFAKLGVFDLGDVVWVASLGAVLGDLISYLVGKTYGFDFLSRYGRYFFFKEEYFRQTRKLMNEHVGKTIIIGRFNLITRSFAPFVAGASGITFRKFLFFNIIGGILWASSSILIGYIFGHSFVIAARLIGRFITIAIFLSLLFIFFLRYLNKKRYIFTQKYLPILTVNIASLYLFAKITDDVVKHEIIIRADQWLDVFLRHFSIPELEKAMVFITNLFSPLGLASASVLVVLFFARKRLWLNAIILSAGLGGGFLLSGYLKNLITRARPPDGMITETDFSFPSTHATIAAIFFFFLFYVFKDVITSRAKKYLLAMICLSAVLLVGFSRLYLHVHWLTDVIAGYALGLFWTTILIVGFNLAILAFEQGLLVYNKFGDRVLVALGWSSWKNYLVKKWRNIARNTQRATRNM